MQRRDALKAAGSILGVGVFGAGATGSAAAHPGPYEPYGYVELEGAREAVVSPDGDVAYVAATTGYASVDVSVPDRPRVLADVREPVSEHESGPLRQIYDVDFDAETDALAVVGPANPRPGAVAGVLFVDVSDPAAPERVAFHETTHSIHNCFLRGGVAFLTGNDGAENPLVLVDAASGEELGTWSLSDADAAWSDVDASLRPLHDVFVRGDVAHLALWDAGTWLVDVSDPTDPTAVGSVEAPDPRTLSSLSSSDRRGRRTVPPGNHHYSATDESGDLLAVGKESWARRVVDEAAEENGTAGDGTAGAEYVGGPSGIDLWDVSDPAAPEPLSTIAPPPSPDPTYGGVWTTAHNFEIRDGRLYSSWYQGGVKRHDVSNPRAPRELSWWRRPDETRFWTARLAAPGAREGFFVASSMGVADVPGRLYTFPDHAGRQADPPTLVEGEATDSVVVTATDGTDEPAETATRTPGFGVGVAAGSLSLAGWLLRRRTGTAGGDDSGKDTRRS